MHIAALWISVKVWVRVDQMLRFDAPLGDTPLPWVVCEIWMASALNPIVLQLYLFGISSCYYLCEKLRMEAAALVRVVESLGS
jgi:hypothetical protein